MNEKTDSSNGTKVHSVEDALRVLVSKGVTTADQLERLIAVIEAKDDEDE